MRVYFPNSALEKSWFITDMDVLGLNYLPELVERGKHRTLQTVKIDSILFSLKDLMDTKDT